MARIKLCITRLRKVDARPRRAKQFQATETWAQFQKDVSDHLNQLLPFINSRWLVSILDTYADYGTPVEARNAILGTVLTTWERSHETARTGRPNQKLKPYRDGLTLLATTRKEDAIRNLFRRLSRLLKETPLIDTIFKQLFERILVQDDALLGRLEAVSTIHVRQQCRRTLGILPQPTTMPSVDVPSPWILPLKPNALTQETSRGIVTGANSTYWPCLGAIAIAAHRLGVGLAVADHGLEPEHRDALARIGVRWITHTQPSLPDKRALPSDARTWWKPWICEASPFSRSVWIDSDAVIVGENIDELFSQTAQLCPATTPLRDWPKCQKEYTKIVRRRFGDKGLQVLPSVCQANAGIVAFTKTSLLKKWQDYCLLILSKPRLLQNSKTRDQAALILTLVQQKLTDPDTVCLLPESYNHKGPKVQSQNPSDILLAAEQKCPRANIVHWHGRNKPWPPPQAPVIAREPLHALPVAHFVWIGGSPLSEMAKANITRFEQLHPAWDIRIHYNPPAQFNGPLRKVYDEAPLLCQKTDILRIWLLDTYGGIYVDADVVPYRACDELIGGHPWAIDYWGKPGNGIMYSPPRTEFTQSYIRHVLKTPPHSRTAYGPQILKKMQSGKSPPKLLDAHLWGGFPRKKRRDLFFRANLRQRQRMMRRWSARHPKKVVPFGVHIGTGLNRGCGCDHAPIFGRTEEILKRLPNQPCRGVEVGVLRGENAAGILRSNPQVTLDLVDTWPDKRVLRQAVGRLASVRDRARIHQMDSVAASAKFPDSSFDFVFLDADHSLGHVRQDLVAWSPKVKAGGWIGGHDYGHPGLSPDQRGVKTAVDEWAACNNLRVELGADYTWFCQIPSPHK